MKLLRFFIFCIMFCSIVACAQPTSNKTMTKKLSRCSATYPPVCVDD